MVFELEIPKKQFLAHLGLLNNNRIIFSGAFGTGKTYFLEKFFDKEDSEYEAIHLFPVNYSVASNEDIFELIKYDILFKLLEKGLAFDNMSKSKVAFLPFFLKEHGTDLIPLLLGAIPKVGGSLKNISEGLINLNKAFKNEYKDLNFTDEDRIISYLDSFNDKKGSTNEEDFFTQLICELVKQLKDKGKEAVLIIDDLDRIRHYHEF
jgi:Cdc6-like AAA superfamily ATPase